MLKNSLNTRKDKEYRMRNFCIQLLKKFENRNSGDKFGHFRFLLEHL
jgi:hypothetical protein